jgi:SpoVK/Ycf46/Vps4 family AAA+-type ATPase
MRLYRFAQQMLDGPGLSMLFFDELEDVLPSGQTLAPERHRLGKAWFNRQLETNPIPTLFVSNSVKQMDPAYVRRFDVVIEVHAPSPEQRHAIVKSVLGDFIGEATVRELASRDEATPAIVERARRVVELASGKADMVARERAYRRLVSQTLRAQGERPLDPDDADRPVPEVYDPALTNADCDLAALAEGLARTRAARLLLWGPPGTGKTAVGRWLAEQLGVPLQVERASTLLGAHVGESEAAIAAAFQRARQSRALLMIDECDSFLMSRRQAQRSWEITLVNELLTQMETFTEGVLVMSSNMVDLLDEAVLRRFDLKVRCGFLTPPQAAQLLERYCMSLGLPAPCDASRRTVMAIPNLAPGDFALVGRQSRFRPVRCAQAFAAQLQGESRLKDGPERRPMGFVA